MERIIAALQAAPGNLIHAILSTRRHQLIVVYSNVATPFSRCRAFCRWLLRAGHRTLPSARFRRLRGGVFGWKHKQGPLSRPIMQRADDAADMEARMREMQKASQQETIDVD
jgi:hypothetical protein